ncbi:MAG: DUF4433 domain-containing protein, partial [Coriobacteriia bacterium]|nr:DUF4433 domain-containing protein [Coriobacteriia bacterium]
VDNLRVCLRRGAAHAPNCTPSDGLFYKPIHNTEVQRTRHSRLIPCGPGGTIHDYVPFYFGPLSPMLYQLHTGWVGGYDEGQEPLIYIVSSAQAVRRTGVDFVFSDGHGIAAYTKWYDDLDELAEIDWDTVYAKWWRSTVDDMDRQRRKQAEFLVHRLFPWQLVREIAVLNAVMEARVAKIMAEFPNAHHPVAQVRAEWYY